MSIPIAKFKRQVKSKFSNPLESILLETERIENTICFTEKEFASTKCIKITYLIKLWALIKEGRYDKTKSVKLYNIKDKKTGKIETFKLDKKESFIRGVTSSKGIARKVRSNQCTLKPYKDWTIDDFTSFLWPYREEFEKLDDIDICTKSKRNKESYFVYVVCPNEIKFEDFIDSLKDYVDVFIDSAREVNKDFPQIYFWNRSFQENKRRIYSFDDRKLTTEVKLLKTDLIDYLKDIKKFIPLFNERLIYLDNWVKPLFIEKSWCWLELCSCFSTKNNSTKFIYPEHIHLQFGKVLSLRDDFEMTNKKGFNTLKLPFIKDLIEKTDPFKLNCSIKCIEILSPYIYTLIKGGFETAVKVLSENICNLYATKIDNTVFELVPSFTDTDVDSSRGISRIKIGMRRLRKASIFMRRVGEYSAAFEYLRIVGDLSESIEEYENSTSIVYFKCVCLVSLSRIHKEIGEYNESLDILDDTDKKKNTLSNREYSNDVSKLINILRAEVHCEIKKYKIAVTYLDDAINSLTSETNSVLYAGSVKFAKRSTVIQATKFPPERNRKTSIWTAEAEGDDDNIANKLDEEEATKYRKFTMNKIEILLFLSHIYTVDMKDPVRAYESLSTAKEDLQSIKFDHFVEMGKVEIGLADRDIFKHRFPGAIKRLSKALIIFENSHGDCNPLVKEVHEKIALCKEEYNKDDALEHKENIKRISLYYYGQS